MNLIRYYHQNRKQIWRMILIILSAILLLQLINYLTIKKDEKNKENKEEETMINTTNQITLTTQKSVVSGNKISKNKLQEEIQLIDQFISYCNQKELEKAYHMLTDKCKEQNYKTLEIFEQNYYNNVFEGENKSCMVENWVNDTYKVRLIEDILATGKSNDGYAKQDYITIEENEEGENKLNINNYIGYSQINKTTQKDNITVEVLDKNTYMEYEEYTMKITNQTENVIVLCDREREDVKTIYLKDSKANKYSSYLHELTQEEMTIEPEQTRQITIKFYSSYRETKKIEQLVFSDMVLKQEQRSEKIELRVDV